MSVAAPSHTLTLTADELCDLTGKRRASAQARALKSMGVEHRTRPDGSVAVLRAHLDALLGANTGRSVRPAGFKFDWGSAGAKSA